MAKKVVAALQKAGSKNLAKIIRPARSPKTGAYTFREVMAPLDQAKEILAQRTEK